MWEAHGACEGHEEMEMPISFFEGIPEDQRNQVARRNMERRFFALRRGLPVPVDAEMARQCETASVVLDHHGMTIHYALELLAGAWRSQAVVDQLEQLDGLGSPAERLDALYSELAG